MGTAGPAGRGFGRPMPGSSCVMAVLVLLASVVADDGHKKVQDQEALAGTVLGAESDTVAQIVHAEAAVKATQDKMLPAQNHVLQLKAEKKSLEAAIEHLRPRYMRTYQPVISIGNELLKSSVQRQSLEVDRDSAASGLPELEQQTVSAESMLQAARHRLAALKLKLNPGKASEGEVGTAPLFFVARAGAAEKP